MRKIMILMLLLFLTGCSTIKHKRGAGKSGIARIPGFTTGQGTLNWVHYDASKRGSMIFVDKNGNVRILAENPPDAAIQSITDISAKVKGIEGQIDVEAALKTQRTIAELGKRTAAVNMLRDALYRVNEMYYATVDKESNILDFRKDLVDKYISTLNTEDKEINLSYIANSIDSIYPINLYKLTNNNETKTLSSEDLKSLIDSIISKVADIAKTEAVEGAKVVKSNNELEVKKYETKLKILETCNSILTDTTITTHKKKQEEFEKCLKNRNY